MPVIENSTYRAPWWLRGGHAQTIYPALFRNVGAVTTRRERLETDDGDFLDLEWAKGTGSRLAIISHGLEGSSRAAYVQGMAGALNRRGWSVLAWSFRGCGGEANKLPSFYHSGMTEDLDRIVKHAIGNGASKIDLVGFSLGGNLTLKYAGERGGGIDAAIGRVVAFSVPCDLACASRKLADPGNRLYMDRFLRSLRRKVVEKRRVFPGELDEGDVGTIRTFAEFDGRFTAPLHGFADAEDYWARGSSKPFLENLRVPALLVSAANDPILGPDCYPENEARHSEFFHLEIPAEGGHVGFRGGRKYWSEMRAAEFLGEG